MRVQVSIESGDSGIAVTDLYRWLRQDDQLRRDAEVRLLPPSQTNGSMNAVEIIELVIGQAVAMANFAVAYAAWRQGRRATAPVTITVGELSVTVTDGSEEAIRRIVDLLQPESDQ
ncbi:effector-associated constant component EACC1 [Streptomyces sp. NBC_01233]|uniref:effector-associated constant component EACC1 n=1 Tax=Streptomyces sp. NBC_01233 TaxID=2903787 RepID=UPI002E1198F2|nr:hypothetical protein OG332_47130 [Streptomyces sp. NBC_01233]